MKTSENYISPEIEEIMVKTEACIAASGCEGHAEGDHGCSDDVCDFD